ncbi:DUF2461 domain-containing protein [Portibacter marinus]|uniref:DUF2461 domain-containing protein n=1 Tax=Portibacter marinus TaxID=2898660 RepID=UPI001F174C4A|nr:DUF2461 domain-containing protein [Portibacter marinus]
MNNRKIFDFLRDLQENNSKEWMDENRDRYHEAKEIWIDQCAAILDRLAKIDPKYGKIEPKSTIMRINNNRMFHPDRPVYKDNFAFSPGEMSDPALYVHVSPNGSFMGGGLHHPDNKTLKKIRAAIDYDGEELLKILQEDKFQQFYGGLSEDPDQLKTSPRGYSEDHQHIELLRRKNFTAIHSLTQKEVNGSDFTDIVERGFKIIQPFNAYLKKAIDFEA